MIKTLNAYKGMTLRNIKVYAKDKMAILLSMLTQIIVLGLYLFFLKDNYVNSILNTIENMQISIDKELVENIVNSWLISGVISTAVVTVSLNTLTVMVMDKEKKINFDYSASPVKNSTVVLSYYTGAVINTFVISSVLLTAGFLFLGINGGFLYSATDILKVYSLTALGSISSTTILMFIISFIKKSSSLSSFSALVSAAIGFIVGAYIPVSQFSSSMQTVVNLVPGSQIAGMFRNIFMTPAINNLIDKMNIPDTTGIFDDLSQTFALKMSIFDNFIKFDFMIIYSVIAIVVFLILNLISYKISSKNRD